MTLLEQTKQQKRIPLLTQVAKIENTTEEHISRGLAMGTVTIPRNKNRDLELPMAVGAGLKTKVNANIGSSREFSDINFELKKLRVAEKFGADAVMDLSTSFDLKQIRKKILNASKVPIGTVPMYEIVVLGTKKYGSLKKIPESFFLKTIEGQAKDGVDFFTIHSGVNRRTVRSAQASDRIMGVVSRGGALIMDWMLESSRENPMYSFFDEIIDIARAFDVTISLGDGMRPGAIHDSTDRTQIEELLELGELRKRAVKKGVQVIIEGPGHVPLNQIKANIDMQKSICEGAPFYVLGPIVTDIAPGYDHITGAIGGAIAAWCGADFLCYVTPSEHLRLPDINDVKEGVIASKIAAHAADIAKGIPGAIEKDNAMSRARSSRDWKKQFAAALDPIKCRNYRKSSMPSLEDVCTMCGEYCSIKISEKCLKKK